MLRYMSPRCPTTLGPRVHGRLLPPLAHGARLSLKQRTGKRSAHGRPTIRSSQLQARCAATTEEAVLPAAQNTAGNALGRLYVALLPGMQHPLYLSVAQIMSILLHTSLQGSKASLRAHVLTFS